MRTVGGPPADVLGDVGSTTMYSRPRGSFNASHLPCAVNYDKAMYIVDRIYAAMHGLWISVVGWHNHMTSLSVSPVYITAVVFAR